MSIKFSHSKLDIVRQCLKKYHFKYIIKPTVEDDDRQPAEFGGLIHDIAEFYKGGGKKGIIELLKEKRPQYKFEKEFYNERLKVALKNIHIFWTENLKGVKPGHIFREQNITVEIGNGISVNGKIDLVIIDEKTGKVRIIDYKTNKSKKYGDHSNQLSMYMYLIHEKFDVPYEDMQPEIVYLSLAPEEKDGTPVENIGYENISKMYDLDDSDVAMLLEEIEAIDHRINRASKAEKWVARPTWFNCTYCPFSELCDKKYCRDDD